MGRGLAITLVYSLRTQGCISSHPTDLYIFFRVFLFYCGHYLPQILADKVNRGTKLPIKVIPHHLSPRHRALDFGVAETFLPSNYQFLGYLIYESFLGPTHLRSWLSLLIHPFITSFIPLRSDLHAKGLSTWKLVWALHLTAVRLEEYTSNKYLAACSYFSFCSPQW